MTTSEHTRKAVRVATQSAAYANRPNACTICGAFRSDGQPPTVHFTGCHGGPDGLHQPAQKRRIYR